MFNDALLWERVGVRQIVDFAVYASDLEYLDPDDAPVRELYVSSCAIEEIQQWSAPARDQLIAEMVQFLVGGPVIWGDPKSGNHMKPLDPSLRFAEFKVRQRPQTRLFGAFVRQDAFVAHMAALRTEAPAQDALLKSWIDLWGEDADRMDFAEPENLLTNLVAKV
jgi:hypothetical protein